jgi:hypothetical protein
VAYQDLEQASGRLMVIDPAGGTTGSDPQGNYRSQGSEAAAERRRCGDRCSALSPSHQRLAPLPSPSRRINVEQALIDSMLSWDAGCRVHPAINRRRPTSLTRGVVTGSCLTARAPLGFSPLAVGSAEPFCGMCCLSPDPPVCLV